MIKIYVDGSGRMTADEKIGAYAFNIYQDDKSIYQSSSALNPGTVSTAELTGVINAIFVAQKMYPEETLTIYTDSQYVVNLSSHPRKVKTNKQLWELYAKITDTCTVKIEHVKGHSDNSFNAHVHSLAKKKLKEQFV